MASSPAQADQALAEAEATRRRLDFLLEASTALGSSLDFEESLNRLARLAAENMADLCLVDVVEPNGAMRRTAVAHDPGSRRGAPGGPGAPVGRAVPGGRAVR